MSLLADSPEVFLADDGECGLLGGADVRGIFGSPYAAAPLGGAGMSTAEPRFLLPASQIPAAASTDTEDLLLELPDAETRRPGTPTRWLVTEIQPDGTGWASLLLRAAPAEA